MYKVVLISLMATLQVVNAQITPSVQKHLLNLANEEITRQLVNGSDDKNANLSAQTQKSLESMVQAGQIISYLSDESPKNEAICEWLTDVKLDSSSSTQSIYYKSEGLSLFKCSSGDFDDVKNVLATPEKYLTSVSDYYHAYLIEQNAKSYGVQDSSKLQGAIDSQIKNEWIKKFSDDKFALSGEDLSIDSFRIVEMMSSSKSGGSAKAAKALKSLISQASTTSSDSLSENQIFFVAPKSAHSQKSFDLTQANLHVLKSLIAAKSQNVTEKFDEKMSNYRNYFLTKTIGHSSVSSVKNAMEALKLLSSQIYLVNEGEGYLLVDTKLIDTLVFNVRDYMGNKLSVKKVISAHMFEIDDSSNNQQMQSKVKVLDGGSQISVKFEDVEKMKWASYALKFELEAADKSHYFVTKTFQVKTKIYDVVSTSFAQTAGWDYPDKYQVSSGFPVEFDAKDTSTHPIIHIQIDAQFFGDKDKEQYPDTLYVTLQKDDQLPYSAHADYIQKIQRYQIDFDLRYVVKPAINGDYKFILHVEDSRAVNKIDQNLGTLSINFDDGSVEATNFGIREDFKLLDKITNYFPPEEKQKGAMIPMAFSAVIVGLFLHFMGSMYGNSANLSNITFGGFIFSMNYILILLIIIAFWIKINLVNTLWILLAVTPVTLYTMNLGLTPSNCHISEFEKKEEKGSSGKKTKSY